MEIPAKIRVGGHYYEVLFPYKFLERSDLVGQSDHGLKLIRIDDTDSCNVSRPESAIKETFLHELIHCADNLCNSKLEESQVAALSEALFQILSDNGLLNL